VCLKCVIVKPRWNEEAQAHIGLSSHRKKRKLCLGNLHFWLSSYFILTQPPGAAGGGGGRCYNLPDFDAVLIYLLSNHNSTRCKNAEYCHQNSSCNFSHFFIPRLVNASGHPCSQFLIWLINGLCLSLVFQLGSGHPCTLFLVSLISFASPFSDPSSVTTPSFRYGLSGPWAPELSIPIHGLPPITLKAEMQHRRPGALLPHCLFWLGFVMLMWGLTVH
jgi:hypothetical protein